VADQVDVQLVGVLGRGDGEHLVVRLFEGGPWPEQPQSAAHPVDVRVDRDLRASEGEEHDHGGGLPTHARKTGEEIKRGFAGCLGEPVEIGRIPQFSENLLDARRLGRAETARLDGGLDLLGRRVPHLLPSGKPLAQPGVGDIAVAVVGVLGENPADELGDWVAVRFVHRPPIELPQPVADREHPTPRGAAPVRIPLGDARSLSGRNRRDLAGGEHYPVGERHRARIFRPTQPVDPLVRPRKSGKEVCGRSRRCNQRVN
jgi:hypothetical protein